MRKRKSGSTYVTDNENDDGWLSTRNKKKISPPMKMPGRQHSLHRAVPRSPLVLLMDDDNLQLMSAKKQTSIGDFFTSRLKPLSSADSTVGTPQHHASVQHITAEGPEDENSAMYADFDMPPATPSQVFTQSAISCGSKTKRVSTPSSPGFDSKYSCPSYSDSCHDEKSAENTSCTIQSCSGEVCSTRVIQRAENTSCTEQSCPGDVCLTRVQQREDGRKKGDEGEGRYSSYRQSQAGPGEFPCDSLLTPDFLKGGCDTVSTEDWSGDLQPVKVQTPGSSQGVKRKRNLSRNSDGDWRRGSYKTLEQTTSLTEMSSLHFTEYHSISLSLDVSANTSRVPLGVCDSTPRVQLDVSANNPTVTLDVSVSTPKIPQQLCKSVHSVTAQHNPQRSSHHGVDSSLKGREMCGDSPMTPVFSSKSNCDSLPRDDQSQLYSRHKPTCVYTTRGEELRSDSLMTPTFSNTSVRDYLPVDNDSQHIDTCLIDEVPASQSNLVSDNLQTPGFLQDWSDNLSQFEENDG